MQQGARPSGRATGPKQMQTFQEHNLNLVFERKGLENWSEASLAIVSHSQTWDLFSEGGYHFPTSLISFIESLDYTLPSPTVWFCFTRSWL